MIPAKGWLGIFILLSVLYLAAILFNAGYLEFYVKPALLLPLIIAVFISKNSQNKKFLVVALIFSWAGDTLLLFVFENAVYFILGLIAFLLAHIFYIVLFARELKKANSKIELRKPALFLITIYLVTMLAVLIPRLGSLTVPVIVYAVVISTMLYMAYLLSSHWPKPASGFLFTGAISFILSDSILAFDKFYHPITGAGFLIMITYLYAQWALVKSCIK